MKRIPLGILLNLFCLVINAQSSWHIVVDANNKIPLADVKALAKTSYEYEFYILSNDGYQKGPYKEAKFEFIQNSSIDEIPTDNKPIISLSSDLKLYHLKEGWHISLYNIEGIQVYETVADSNEVIIPLISFEPGVYALIIDSTSYKIIVK